MEFLDLSKLPEWQREVVKKTSELMLKTPDSAILSGLNAKASQYLQIPRITIQSPEDKAVTPCNYYGILFMASGSGKDRLLNFIQDNFFSSAKQLFKAKSESYILDATEHLETKLLEIQTKAARELYRQNHAPRYLNLQSSDGTPEGFIADREAYAISGFGGTFFQNSEFVNYLKTKDQNKEALLSLIGEVFDKGNSNAKTIKGVKKCVSVEGVPNTMFVHTTVADIHNSNVFDQILESLNRQLARRSYICFPTGSEFKEIPKDAKSLEKCFTGNKDLTICNKYDQYFKECIENLSHEAEAAYKLTPEAKLAYFEYYLKCNEYASLFDSTTKDGLISEVLGRPWKMLKLAGIIHSFKQKHFVENVPRETIEEAIYQTDFYGQYYEKFYNHSAADELTTCYQWLKSQKGKQILKTDIRAKNFVNKNKFTKWFNDSMVDLKDLAAQDGLIFEEINNKGNIKAFVIKDISQ